MRGDGVGHGLSFGPVSYVPFDLVLTGLVGAGAHLVITVGAGGAPQLLAGGFLLFILPGYVTLATLFPELGPERALANSKAARISLRQRAVLTVGVSLFVVVLLGLVVGTVYTAITAALVSGTALIYVLVVGGIAAVRRYQTPARDRFSLPVEAWYDEAVGAFTHGSLTSRALTVGVVCSVLLTAAMFGFALGTGSTGQTYTDFYLVTPDGDGEYTSGGYPENMTLGQQATLTWGVHNAESQPTNYTVVVVLERVVESGGESRVIESEELNRTSVRVADDADERRNHTVQPSMVGEDLRLGYYLYRGEAPDRIRTETAYRHLHIWTTVEPSA